MIFLAIIAFFLFWFHRKRKTGEVAKAASNELEDTSPKKGLPGTWYRAELEHQDKPEPQTHELDGNQSVCITLSQDPGIERGVCRNA